MFIILFGRATKVTHLNRQVHSTMVKANLLLTILFQALLVPRSESFTSLSHLSTFTFTSSKFKLGSSSGEDGVDTGVVRGTHHNGNQGEYVRCSQSKPAYLMEKYIKESHLVTIFIFSLCEKLTFV